MLQTRGLRREFGARVVVESLDLDVKAGRITGFVGANGAGKTTTMRMIVGVLAPTAGDILWDAAPITAAARRRIGYMPEERGLYPRMPIGDQLVFLARLYGATTKDGRQRAEELLGHFGLAERVDDMLESLSLGNQQRVQIAASLIHRPDALVLDEPFSGLDPVAVDQMIDLLRREAGDKPVLFSSHQLDLVERLCDDLVILSNGRVVASGSVDELRSRGPVRYKVEFAEDVSWLNELSGIDIQKMTGTTALIDLAGVEPAQLLETLVARSSVIEFARVHPPLSDIYRDVAS